MLASRNESSHTRDVQATFSRKDSAQTWMCFVVRLAMNRNRHPPCWEAGRHLVASPAALQLQLEAIFDVGTTFVATDDAIVQEPHVPNVRFALETGGVHALS